MAEAGETRDMAEAGETRDMKPEIWSFSCLSHLEAFNSTPLETNLRSTIKDPKDLTLNPIHCRPNLNPIPYGPNLNPIHYRANPDPHSKP